MVPHLEIDRVFPLQRRYPGVDRFAPDLGLQHPVDAVADHPVRLIVPLRHCAIDQGNWDSRCKRTESGIDDKNSLGQPDREKHMRARCLCDRRVYDDPRAMADGLKSQLLEDGCKQCCMLEATAAAASLDQLGLNARQIETYATAQQDVEILERDA